MTGPVRFLPEAEAEMEAAFWWYERQRAGLGLELLDMLGAALRRIAERPRSFPRVQRRTRKVVVRRFPYLIFYTVDEDRILITGVFHAHRDPTSWADRVRDPGRRRSVGHS